MDPAGAGDQYNFAFERAADLVFFQAYGVAAEEVFDGDVADLPNPLLLIYLTTVYSIQSPGKLLFRVFLSPYPGRCHENL